MAASGGGVSGYNKVIFSDQQHGTVDGLPDLKGIETRAEAAHADTIFDLLMDSPI